MSRTVTGTIYHPGTTTAWASATIKFRLIGYFATVDRSFPTEIQSITTDLLGAFSTVLATPTNGYALYACTLPGSNVENFTFYIATSVTPITLEALINGAGGTGFDVDTLEVLLSELTFLDLADTPNAYTGQASKVVSVNAGETGLEFTVGGAGGSPVATPTLTGTVKIDTIDLDPTVYLKTSVDTLLGLRLLISNYDWTTLPNKPATFAPTAHIHPESDITSLVADLGTKLTQASGDVRYAQLAAPNIFTQMQSIGDAYDAAKAVRALNLIATNAVMRIWRASAGATDDSSVELMASDVDGVTLKRQWDMSVIKATGAFVIRDRLSTPINAQRIVVTSTGSVLLNKITGLTGAGDFDTNGNANIGGTLSVGGILTAPTAANGTNTTQAATTAFVQSAIALLVASSPATLDTLNELAAALGNDPNFATTIATSIGLKLAKASNLSDLASIPTAKTNLGLNLVENTALSTWAGSANITILGTVVTGVWNGTLIAAANGGTGTNNTGNLAWPSSGGTAALLGTANVFTQPQTINGANLGIAITGAASGGTPSIVASSPVQVAGATAGTPLQITASPAIAGSGTVGAAAGGNVTITAGDAARLTSGNAAGGNINLVPGAGIGSGLVGQVFVPVGASATVPGVSFTGFSNYGFGVASNLLTIVANSTTMLTIGAGTVRLPTTGILGWPTSSITSASTTGIARNADAIVEINTGTAGQWGAIKTGTRDANLAQINDSLILGRQNASGTILAGFGNAIKININNTTTAEASAMRLTSELVVPTGASYTTRAKVNVYDFNGSKEAMRWEADGTNVMLGVLGATAKARQTVAADATDLASALTLVNDIKAKLGQSVGFGFFAN